MKYVAVQHNPGDTKVWWFAVPEKLESKVYIGAVVVCDTRKGKAKGGVVHIMEGIPQEKARSIIGDRFPLKSIIAVYIDAPMEDIYIPMGFLARYPSPNKIALRVAEFYDTGRFDTRVVFDQDGQLKDGYTAYLVAKMFGHDTLHGLCVCGE